MSASATFVYCSHLLLASAVLACGSRLMMTLPQALNALNSGLIKDICTAAEAFEADPEVAALVLTGSERAFAGKRLLRKK